MSKRYEIECTIDDLVADFLYYDRKEDESLRRGDIEKFVKTGEVTVVEMVEWFRIALRNGLKE